MFDRDKENREQVFMASPACSFTIPCPFFCQGKGRREKEGKKGFRKDFWKKGFF